MQSDDDTADRVNGDDDQMMVFHACSRPNLYHGSGLPIKCIESARRRAIATDFNVSEDLLARPLTEYTAHAANVSYSAQCAGGYFRGLFKGEMEHLFNV